MPDPKSQEKFEAAIELKLLNEKQLEAIKLEQQNSNYPSLEIAIRKGFLNRRQLDLIEILADPLSVVPGYRIEGVLGQGGAGTVYKATQLRMDRPVAIKTINRAVARNDLSPKRFEREAKIVGRLRHPNIISAFDFGIHNQQLYLVMELVDGIDAENMLTQKNRIPESHAWYVAQQVCHALDNAKQHDVIHRDIKPGNLILTTAPAGTQLPASVPFVKVGDFGLAKFSDKQLDATITLDHAVSGTPFYMSPEQIKAEEIDHRSDIYSLGTTIWHLVTGAPPVMGAGALDVITSKMKLEDEWLAEPPDDISIAGFELLKKMCRHDREQRIDDYSALNREIKSVIEQLGQASLTDTGNFELVDNPYSMTAKVTTIHELAKTFITDGDDHDNSNPVEAAHDFATGEMKTDESLQQLKQPARSDSELPKKDGQRFFKFLVVAIGAMLIPAIVYFLLPRGQQSDSDNGTSEIIATSGDKQDQTFVTLDEFEGPPMMLFNGRSVDPTQKFSGTWEPAEGAEGGAILSGVGTRNFRCRDLDRNPLDHYRFVCGFRHNEADIIGFRLLSGSEKDEPENVLWEAKIEKDKASLINGETIATSPLQQFDDDQNFGYHQFRLDSQPNHWRIEIDGELLGEIPKPSDGSLGEQTVQLFVTGDGPAHFETLNFRSFKLN